MPFPTSDAESRIAHQPKNGRKPRASAMQNIDASGIPVRPASCGPACKTEGLLSTTLRRSRSTKWTLKAAFPCRRLADIRVCEQTPVHALHYDPVRVVALLVQWRGP